MWRKRCSTRWPGGPAQGAAGFKRACILEEGLRFRIGRLLGASLAVIQDVHGMDPLQLDASFHEQGNFVEAHNGFTVDAREADHAVARRLSPGIARLPIELERDLADYVETGAMIGVILV